MSERWEDGWRERRKKKKEKESEGEGEGAGLYGLRSTTKEERPNSIQEEEEEGRDKTRSAVRG